MPEPKIGVVIPVGAGREANLNCVLDALEAQTLTVGSVMVYGDGLGVLSQQVRSRIDAQGWFWTEWVKHEPGLEQPRNVGTRILGALWPDLTHVWFIDSDVVVEPTAHELIELALQEGGQDRILVLPYDWLGPGWRPDAQTGPGEFLAAAREVSNDPRWAMFREHDFQETFTNDLSKGLACFSGNLVWPVGEFRRVGGFWAEIHHGRCEDGELGLRAVAMDVPIGLLREARGYHLHHDVNTQLACERNARDVPMLNDRHPWMEQGAVFMVDRDGKAFDVLCRCEQVVPTNGWWEHAATCPALTGKADKYAIPVGE